MSNVREYEYLRMVSINLFTVGMVYWFYVISVFIII